MSENSNPELVLLGINHNTAPIEVRERLAISAERLPDAIRSLSSVPGIREGLILATCNRVELLTVQDDAPDLLSFLHHYFSVPAATIKPHLYEFREREAVRHLFRVASSLDSMIVGEPQILGQVKESYTVARDVGAIAGSSSGGGQLDRLLQSAFTVAKKVRTETHIGSNSVSIASVAVDLARKIFGSLHGKVVLMVGAGKMSELAVRHLVAHGASNLLLSNRTQARAERIAEEFLRPGVSVEVVPFASLQEQASRADIVITSAGAQHHIFTRANGQQLVQRRRGRPMFFIDIAVPRDVDPKINEVEGCFVYDIDDLSQVAAGHQADRNREAAAAEKIVADEVSRYQERLKTLGAVPAILALQEHAEAIRQAEVARNAKALASLTPDQREAVEAITRSLTNKLLHPQIVALRKPTE